MIIYLMDLSDDSISFLPGTATQCFDDIISERRALPLYISGSWPCIYGGILIYVQRNYISMCIVRFPS